MDLHIVKMVLSLCLIGVLSVVVRAIEALVWKPQGLRSKLEKQGIRGPPPAFLVGNIGEIKKSRLPSCNSGDSLVDDVTTHNCSSKLFPFLERWKQEYGPVFVFSMGNLQVLYIYDTEVVKEISTCTSLDLGKPSYQRDVTGPLLGQGILTSNGQAWAHQRKILAPELYAEKVKGMIDLMVESSNTLVNSWKEKIEKAGGVAEIKIENDIRSFSGDVISKACFGSNYAKGQEIFLKLRALQEALSKKVFASGVPGLRYLPTKSNREIWRLEREIRSLIVNVVNERNRSTSEKDLLQMILQSAAKSNELGCNDAIKDRFIVDNCKNIYAAGYETTAVSAAWTLVLLASNPEWQAKVREEVMQVCGGQLPNADMIRKMKLMTMVINESLRLYPPVAIVSREALQDLKFGNIHIPKGVNVWTLMVTLHQDPAIWGLDANKFKPERFTNGVSGACKLPHVYMPFGVGPRTCLGQNFALAELKILLALIVSNFSFSLSPKYKHSPALRLVIEPEFGVDLLIRKLEP